jgi:hypothetical protein
MAKKAKKKAKRVGGNRAAKPTKYAVFYGLMKWLSVDLGELDELPESMPRAFQEARKLHKANASRNLGRVIDLLQPFAHAIFLPGNIDGWKGFKATKSDPLSEIAASWVRLRGVDFKNSGDSPFPLAKMEAEFEVPVKDSFDAREFNEWVAKEGASVYDAVSFGWRIPNGDSAADALWIPWGFFQDVQCELVLRSRAKPPKN